VAGNLWYILLDSAVPKEEILGYNLRPLATCIAPFGAALGEIIIS